MKIRVSIDDRDEKLNYKIRESQTKKIPYTLVLGDKEVETNSVTYRHHGQTEQVNLPLDDFIKMITTEIKELKR